MEDESYAEFEERLTERITERVIARLTERLDLVLRIGKVFLRLLYLLFGALVVAAVGGKPIAKFVIELLGAVMT